MTHNETEKRVQVKVFVTKTRKFRAKITEVNQPSYEVTVGGDSWMNGKGREHEHIIMKKVNMMMNVLNTELITINRSNKLPLREKEGYVMCPVKEQARLGYLWKQIGL